MAQFSRNGAEQSEPFELSLQLDSSLPGAVRHFRSRSSVRRRDPTQDFRELRTLLAPCDGQRLSRFCVGLLPFRHSFCTARGLAFAL